MAVVSEIGIWGGTWAASSLCAAGSRPLARMEKSRSSWPATGLGSCRRRPAKQVPPSVWENFERLTQESSVAVTGAVREDARAPGGYELTVEALEIVQIAEPYPIKPKEHGIEFLLDHRHLWLRSSQQRAIMRVRNEVEKAIVDFYYERGYVRIDSPILTGAIGEGASALFETDYFGEKAYLAQTGQLYIEAAAAALGKVYCFGPTFRAEKSKTRRHLTEFWMVEAEVAWYDSEDNMRLRRRASLPRRARSNGAAKELEVLERTRSSGTGPPRLSTRRRSSGCRRRGDIQWDGPGRARRTMIAEDYGQPSSSTTTPRRRSLLHEGESGGPADRPLR